MHVNAFRVGFLLEKSCALRLTQALHQDEDRDVFHAQLKPDSKTAAENLHHLYITDPKPGAQANKGN